MSEHLRPERILLVGSGGREDALAHAMSKSAQCERLYCAPGNVGIARWAEIVALDVQNHASVVQWCLDNAITLVVIGPDGIIADGLADPLRAAGIAVFAPSKEASQIESSKSFAKAAMHRFGIPTAAYKVFTSEHVAEAEQFIRELGAPVVVKADGLAAGKGVVVAQSVDEGISAVHAIFNGAFGSAGSSILIEEFLRGEEASVFAITDGTSFLTLAPAQDHKRIGEGDTGKNTGGMGAYAPAPIVTPHIMQFVEDSIIRPLIDGMRSEGNPFVGVLFVGLMIDESAKAPAVVVEFNARFGDPETQVVLPVLDADVVELFASAARGALDTSSVRNVVRAHACTVVLASQGYPDAFEKGHAITGIDDALVDARITVYHAGVATKDGLLVTNGGRVLAVTAVDTSLAGARMAAYEACDHIHFDGKTLRRDIAARAFRATA